MTPRFRTPRVALVALAVSALAATAAGCTSSNTSPPTKTTVDAAAKCPAWASVVSAFTTLENGNLTKGDKAATLRNIHALQKADKNFRPTVTRDIKKNIKDLQSSIKSLATAVRTQSGSSSISTAATQVHTSWNALVASVGSSCPSVTATTVAP